MNVMLILIAIIGFLVFVAGAALGAAAIYFMRKEPRSDHHDAPPP